MFGKIVVNAKRMTLRVAKILAHGACSIGRDVLHRRGLRGRCRNYDGVIHRAIVAQNLYHLRNRRALLANGAINTNEIVAFVVDNSIESDGSFSGLTIANDQLALAAGDAVAERDDRTDLIDSDFGFVVLDLLPK